MVDIVVPEFEIKAELTKRHLSYRITQCYLPPDSGEHVLPQLMQATTWCLIYQLHKDRWSVRLVLTDRFA